jgi:hypothetical protein
LALASAVAGEFRAGVSRVKITPPTPFWLSGYASRNRPADAVRSDLWAKALALEDAAGGRWVLVTTDLIGLPRAISDPVVERVHRTHGLSHASVVLNSSHTHAGPAVWPNLSVMFDLNETDAERARGYAKSLEDQLVQAIDLALEDMRPAEVRIGHGAAGFAMNRREPTAQGIRLGVNPGGPVDHDVPVLRVTDEEGAVLAIVFGYACHNTTLGGDFYEVDGDYAGVAQRAVERDYPGATALFLMLCGGDQNPNPRGTVDLAREHGEALSASVKAVLTGNNLRAVKPSIRTAEQTARLEFAPHTREGFARELEGGSVWEKRRARLMVEAYDRGAPVHSLELPVRAARLGNEVTFLALGGEVVVDYALRAKREYGGAGLIVAGYCHDVACYIPSKRVLQEGGYESVHSMIYYGQPGPFAPTVEERVFEAIHAALAGVGVGRTTLDASAPIGLDPGNPHYFRWRGKPTILITSGEHYGAVLNAGFDYRTYLATLAADGLNYTRVFTGGAYVEPLGAFNIPRNTLAPDGTRFLAPWARSAEPGYAGGGNKFDLDRWDPAYFERLKAFLSDAGQKGIVVEVSLFCPFYGEEQWALSPLNRRNNINNTAEVARTNVYTLDQHAGLLAWQERMVKKFVDELRDFDNVFYEICNEPYFGGVTLAWQRRIADVITDAQSGHVGKKLIAQNIANGSAQVTDPHPAVSILNFHYAAPPGAVAMNYGLNRVIGDDETGFRGTNDAPYRMEGWDFVMAGGGLYNNLDYSFVVGHEDGTFVTPASAPGGGNAVFRQSMRALGSFIRSFEFVELRPDDSVLRGPLPGGLVGRALAKEGEQYAVYLRTGQLPGQFSVRWTGLLSAPKAGEYTLITASNDGVRVWLNGDLVIDNWTEHSLMEDRAPVVLPAGQPVPLKVEFFYAGGQMAMQLFWEGADLPRALIPESALRTADGHPGLRAEYFADMTLSARTQVTAEPGIRLAAPSGEGGQWSFAEGAVTLGIELPPGSYRCEWVDSRDGAVVRAEELNHAGGVGRLSAPAFTDDIALAIRRVRAR